MKLERGIPCEVEASVAEMTACMLQGWLEFDSFTVGEPYNGWVVFTPKMDFRNADKGDNTIDNLRHVPTIKEQTT